MRQTDRYVFFFSKYDVFSNWYPCRFQIQGVQFNCVEQAMMYGKARLFGDQATAEKILATSDPKEHKALGRQVRPYDDQVWKKTCRFIVYQAVSAKFQQNPELLAKLLATGGRQLVEASPYDRIWGVGLVQTDPRIEDPRQWKGSNWLGEVLTQLRSDLAQVHHPRARPAGP